MSREMKNSGVEWIGEIPEDWEIIPNKHLMKKVKDLCPIYNSEDILSLSMKGVYVRDPNDESGKRPTTYNGYQYVQEGDLLMCLFDIDVTPRCVGRVYNNGLTSPAYSRFVMNKTRAIVDYYYYYYLALDFDKTLLHLSKNMRSSLTESDFGSINAPVPSPTEQQKIVHFLDRKCTAIDTAIEKTKKSIEKLEEYKKAVITKAVTKGIDPNAKMKDSGVEWIGKIPESWSVGKIKNSYDVTLGKMLETANTQNEDVNNYLCAANIKWNGVSTMPQKKMHFSAKEKTQYLLSDGDVLISEGGTAGTSCIYHNELSPCYIQNSVHRCVANKNSNTKYLYYWMHVVFHSGYINSICHKATIMHYTKEKVEQTPIPVLSSTEQQQIVHFLDRKCTVIDTAIEKKKKAIEKWEEYKKSLIYYAVTGKIDCRNEVIE